MTTREQILFWALGLLAVAAIAKLILEMGEL